MFQQQKKMYDVPCFVFYNPGTDWQHFYVNLPPTETLIMNRFIKKKTTSHMQSLAQLSSDFDFQFSVLFVKQLNINHTNP